MPLRPEMPGLNLTRRTAAPVKLPRMNFPMVGGPAPEAGHQTPEESYEQEAPISVPAQEVARAAAPQQAPAAQSQSSRPAVLPAAAVASRVIVYGRTGCQSCLEAVQDLIDRSMSFAYYDVDRDQQAMQHLEAICGSEPVVPVIIHIGFGRPQAG